MMIILMMIKEVITIITDLMKHSKYQLQQQKVALILMTKLVIGSEAIGHSTEQKMRSTLPLSPISIYLSPPLSLPLPFHSPHPLTPQSPCKALLPSYYSPYIYPLHTSLFLLKLTYLLRAFTPLSSQCPFSLLLHLSFLLKSPFRHCLLLLRFSHSLSPSPSAFLLNIPSSRRVKTDGLTTSVQCTCLKE